MNSKTLTVSLLSVSCALMGCASPPPPGASAARLDHLGADDPSGEPLFDTCVEVAAVQSTWLHMYATQPFLNATPQQIAAAQRPIEGVEAWRLALVLDQPDASPDETPGAMPDSRVANVE